MSVDLLHEYIQASQRIVFFGGAGVSTASGIPDFRSADGLYADHSTVYPPEEILSRSFFFKHPQLFYAFFFDKLLIGGDVRPNAAHLYLAELEKRGKLTAVITQNIDHLHQRAGSRKVLELHGTIMHSQCTHCRLPYTLSELLALRREDGVPYCSSCASLIKPDVVLYEEALDEAVIEEAIGALHQADLLIVGGTSLTVYPAAGMLRYFRGHRLVIINRSATPFDRQADLCLQEDIADVFARLSARL